MQKIFKATIIETGEIVEVVKDKLVYLEAAQAVRKHDNRLPRQWKAHEVTIELPVKNEEKSTVKESVSGGKTSKIPVKGKAKKG